MITVQVGKNGLSDGLLDHVKDACDSHDEVKLDFLQSYTGSRSIDDAVRRVVAYLDPLYDVRVERRGHTATLHVTDA